MYFTRSGQALFLQLQEQSQSKKSAVGRRHSGPSTGVAEDWIRNVFGRVFGEHPSANRTALFKFFKKEVERRIHRSADIYLEERLWAIIDQRIADSKP